MDFPFGPELPYPTGLPDDEIDIADDGELSLEMSCEFCGEVYDIVNGCLVWCHCEGALRHDQERRARHAVWEAECRAAEDRMVRERSDRINRILKAMP